MVAVGGENLETARSYLRPFPKPELVFANRVEEHSQYLLPAALFQLNRLIPGEKGWIPFLIPVEPTSGYLAERSEAYRTYYCRRNWFACRQVNDRWEFTGDFRYFHKAYFEAHPPTTDRDREEVAELSELYPRTHAFFKTREKLFRKLGWLPGYWNNPNPPAPDDNRGWLACFLGGTSVEGNWDVDTAFPLSKYPFSYFDDGKTYDTNRTVPRTEDGRDFLFVGEVETWYYAGLDGVVMLFFDPVERIALTTIEWT